ncbi:MAG: hypothetical protein Q8T09_00300 [Candidatus Melainabacteria bacterium]|nr:hypothetical protein [Candidatus Melainabacteria bacterium]
MNSTAENTKSIIETNRLSIPAERYTYKLQLLQTSIIAGHCYGNWQGVLVITDRLKQLGDLDSHSRLLRAEALIRTGDDEQGIAELIELTNEDPWCAASHNLLGETRLMARKYKEAVRSYTTAISIKPISSIVPDEPLSYTGRAIALTLLGRHSPAAADVNLRDMLCELRKARIEFWSGRYKECSQTIKDLPQRIKDLPAAQYLKLRNTMAEGNYKQALQEFPKLRFNSRGGLPLLWMRALCNYRNGNIECCLTDLTKILNSGESIVLLELNPIVQKVQIVDLSQVLKLRAKCEKHLKNFSAALEDLEKAIYQNPDAATHRSRAEVLYKLGLAERALTDLDIAEKNLPADTKSQQLRMLCLTRIGRKDDAAKIAKSILAIEPGNTIATQTLKVLNNSVSIPIIGRPHPMSNLSADSYMGQ